MKSKWTTFPQGARNTIPAFRQTPQTPALIGGCLGTKGNWYLKKKSSESQLSRWFFPGLQEKQGVRWGQGGGRRDNTLPPGRRRLRSDKDGHRGLTSHPRISQRAITPCGGCLDQAADRSNRSCCSSQPSLGALFKAGDGRGQRRRGWRRSEGKVESETTVCQESTVGGSIEQAPVFPLLY